MRSLFYFFLAVVMVHISKGYMIRSQGYQIVEGVKNSIHQVTAYRFFISFDIPLVNQADFLELSFPVILNKQNTSYPLYRIFSHSLGSRSYQYLGSELSFAANYPSIFFPCTSGSNSTLFFFQLNQDISSNILYIMDIIPEPNIEFSEGIYSLQTVTMKAVSNNHLTNRLVYAHSSDIAMLRFKDNFIPGDYVILEQVNPSIYLVKISQSLSSFPLMVQNGGIIHVEIVSSNLESLTGRISNCSIQSCVISENRRGVMISITEIDIQTLQGQIVLFKCMEVSFEITLLSSTKAVYDLDFKIPNSALAFKKQSFRCMGSLIFGSMKYHWGLDEDQNNQIAVFVSSPSKHVYNTITITFSSNIEQVVSGTSYYFRIEIDLGQNPNSFVLLKTSCATTLPQLDTEHPVLCKQTSSPWTHLNVIQFSNIKQLAQNAQYTVSFRVIVFNGSSAGFRLNSINLLICSNEGCSVIASTSEIKFPVIPSFINNYDTSYINLDNRWSSYLGDIQIISVADTASEIPDQLIKKAFTSPSLNQGGGIFMNRGIESLVFFLFIDPTMLDPSQNKILKMTILADNKFLGFSSSNTAGILLAAQDKVTSSYSFSAQACSQGATPGCYDGSTSEILFGTTSWVMNGKTINQDTSTAKYTLRCGIPGQTSSQPMANCTKMFQGMEPILNMYETGYGGVFVIPKVEIQSTFLSSKLSAISEKSLDFMVTFSLEDPLNLSDINQTIILSTMINAYALSYDPSTKASFLGSFVNLSSDNLNRFSPSFFRLIATHPLPNQFIFIFLDGGVELTSFSDETTLNYSCQVLHQSIQSTYDKNRCIAFQRDNLYYSNQFSSTNFLMNNLVVVSTTTCVSCNSLEIIIPITPSTNSVGFVTMHVGYGELSSGKTFPCGASCFEIRKLITLFGVSSTGPSLQNLLRPFIVASSFYPEDLTSNVKTYGYYSGGQTVSIFGQINPSTSQATFYYNEYGISPINYSEISSDGQHNGAGILLTSVGSDLFVAEFTLVNVTRCSKFSFYSAISKFSPFSSLTPPLNPYDSLIRFAVFCPLNAQNIPNQIQITTPYINSIDQSSNLSFFISLHDAARFQYEQDNRLFVSISEKYGRNIFQRQLKYTLDYDSEHTKISTLIPKSTYSIQDVFSLPFSFKLDFRFPIFIKHKLLIDVELYFPLTDFAVNEVSVLANSVVSLFSIQYSVSLSQRTISFVVTTTEYLQTLAISSLTISFTYQQLTFSYDEAWISNSTAKFSLRMEGGETAQLGGPQQTLYFCKIIHSFQSFHLMLVLNQKYLEDGIAQGDWISIANASSFSPSIQAVLENLVFKKLMLGARDTFRMKITIVSSNKKNYNPKTEKFHLNLGFLRNAKYSQDTCFFYTDETYTEIAHIVPEFQDYTFSFKEAFSLSQAIFFLECNGVALLDESLLTVPFSLSYYDVNSGNDLITEVVKSNISQMSTPEIIYSSKILQKKLNKLTIQRVQLMYQDCGMNGLIIYFHIDNNSYPFNVFLEMIVYLPRAFDLRNQIFSTSLDSTVRYLPKEHALRFKISSDKLIEQTLEFAPIFITQQLIQEATGQYIYFELVNPFINNDINSLSSNNLFSQNNKVIDYAYYKIPGSLFSNVQEQFPDEIKINPVYFPSDFESSFSKIFHIDISFSISEQSLAGIDSVLVVTYIGIGSQIKIDHRQQEIDNHQNGYIVGNQDSIHEQNSLKYFQISQKYMITCSKQDAHDLLFFPIRIQVYTAFDSLLLAVAYNTILNTFSAIMNISPIPLYDNFHIFFLVDSEGDQISSLPLFSELIDISAEWKLNELKNSQDSMDQPLNFFTQDQYQKYFWSVNNQFHFTYSLSLRLAFKKNILINQLKNALNFYPNIDLFTAAPTYLYPLLNVYLNTDSKCNVKGEQTEYHILADSKVGIVRFILDDYCQFQERLQIDWLIPHVPSDFANLEFIQPQFHPEKDTNNVIFQVNLLPNVTAGSSFQITYSSHFSQLNILSTTIQVDNQAKLSTLYPLPPSTNLKSFTYQQSNNPYSQIQFSINCNRASVIYYEIDIELRTNRLLDSSALIAFLRQGQIKQLSLSQTQESTHKFGSFIYQTPSNKIPLIQEFSIEDLRPGTNYVLRLALPDGSFSNNRVLTIPSPYIEERVLLHVQLFLLYIPQSNKALEEDIFNFYLCLLSENMKIPHSRLKFLTRPSASCQKYMKNPKNDFFKPKIVDDSGFCQQVTEQNLQSGFTYPILSVVNCERSQPISFDLDFSFLVELESHNPEISKINKIYQDINQFQLPIMQYNMNQYVISEYVHFCSGFISKIVGIEQEKSNIPKVQLKSCSYNTTTMVSSLYFQQTISVAILYVALTFREWTQQESAIINARSFLEDKMKTDLSVFNRFIYPLENGEIARFNFILPGNQTKYWVYYFPTDLTVQEFVYSYPVQGASFENNTFTPANFSTSPSNSGTTTTPPPPPSNVVTLQENSSSSLNIVMILMIVLPIGGLSILGIVCFYVRYRRKIRNGVKPHKEEVNDENINGIIGTGGIGCNSKQIQGKEEERPGEILGQAIVTLSGNKQLTPQTESKNEEDYLKHNYPQEDNSNILTDKRALILPKKIQIIPENNTVSSGQAEEIHEQDGIKELRTDSQIPFDQNQYKKGGEDTQIPLKNNQVQQQSSKDILGNNRKPSMQDQDQLEGNENNKQENNNFLEEIRDQGKKGKSIQVTKNTLNKELEEQSILNGQYEGQAQEEFNKNNGSNQINQGRGGTEQRNNIFKGQNSNNRNEDNDDEYAEDQDNEEGNSWFPREHKKSNGESNPSLQQQYLEKKMPLKKNNLFDFNNEIDGDQNSKITQQPDSKFRTQKQGRQQQLRKNQGSIEISQTSNNLLEVEESDEMSNQEPYIGLQRGGQCQIQGHKGVVTIEQISNGLLEVESDEMETQEYIGIQRQNRINSKQQGQGGNEGRQDQERMKELEFESELDFGEETGREQTQEFRKRNLGNNKDGREPNYQRGNSNSVLEIESQINMDEQSYLGKKPQANRDIGIQGKRARGKINQGLQQQLSNDLLELESDFNIGDSNQLLRQSVIDQQDIQKNTNRPSKGNEVGKRRYSNGLLELESNMDFEESKQSGAKGRKNPNQITKGQSGNEQFSNELLELESDMDFGEARQSGAQRRGNPIQMNKGQSGKQQFSNGLLEVENDMDFRQPRQSGPQGRGNPNQMTKGKSGKGQFSNGLSEIESDKDFGEATYSGAQGKKPFRKNKGSSGTGYFSNELLELESDMDFGGTRQPGAQGRENPIQMDKGQPKQQQSSNGLLELESDMNLGEEIGLQLVMPSKINSKLQGNEHLKSKGPGQPRSFSNSSLELENDMDFGEGKRSGVQLKLNQGQSGIRKFSNGLLELENDMNFGDSIGSQQIQSVQNDYGAQGIQYQNELKKGQQRRFSNGLFELESNMIFGEAIGLNQIMPSKNQKQSEANRYESNKDQDGMKQFSNGLLELESDMNFGDHPQNQQISQKNYAEQQQSNKLKQGQTRSGFQQNNSIEDNPDIEEQVGRKHPFSQKTSMNVQKQQNNQGRNDGDFIEEYEGLQSGSKGQQEGHAADNIKIKQGQLKVNELSKKQGDNNTNLDIIQQVKKQKAEQAITNQKKSNQRQRKLFNNANADDIEEYKTAIKNQISSSKQPETTNSKSTKQGKLIKTDRFSKGKNTDQDLEEYSNSKRQGSLSEKQKMEDQNIKDERLKKLQMARDDIIDDYDIQEYNGGNQLLQIEDNNDGFGEGKGVFNGRKEKMTVTFYNKQQKDQHHDDLEEINL